jgi:nucleoside-diphosphate-sugar epimerase/cyclopropane fatty-acyl-phospholipid synthase-like methyltransferase
MQVNKFKKEEKMEKIVITGGLGYLGTELCKIYSGESRYKDITVLDRRFVSERVKQLRDWGIKFVQGSILDDKLLKKHLEDADVVIHFAGITDVAYTKSDTNEERDQEIVDVGVKGTRNVIKYTPHGCRVVFPSTHVVYEGFDDVRRGLREDEAPCPILTYSKVKVQSEVDLQESDKDYVIVRLASVYGYSTDTMRMGIMPNLFSKIASQGGSLKLFGGGKQLKSLVPLLDVARCFKFMADRKDISREIFHCAKDSLTVKEVAQVCKKIKPDLQLVETDDEVPNLGYTISNEKLLSTGFEFLYTLEGAIKEMIENWSPTAPLTGLESVVKGSNEYVDERGKISNYELTEPINLLGYIESKSGTVRANHYHPIQEQKCLLVKGQYISVLKDLSYEGAPLETQVINAGDLAVIKPNVAHTMVFTQDSVFLNLVRGEREHDNYGITHTLPYKLVDDALRDKLLGSYKMECRACGHKELKQIISFGEMPLANNLIDSKNEETDLYPLEVNYCPHCHNCQLSCVVDPTKMFDNYLYVSSTSKVFQEHFEKAASKYIQKFNLDNKSTVLDIGSNDGIALKPFLKAGVKVIGIEPAANIAKIANHAGVPTINEYFDKKTAKKIYTEHGKVDLVTASNVFAHADDLKGITECAFELLKTNGTFVVEVQYFLDTMKDLTFDNIYHEHVNYWSVTSINNFFQGLGCTVTDVEHIDTHGGSIRVYVKQGDHSAEGSVPEFLSAEDAFGMRDYGTYQEFATKVFNIRRNVRTNMEKVKAKFKTVAGYGSPAKATTFLNFFGITDSDVDYIIEDNVLKNNKCVPGVNIPIKDKEYCFSNLPDVVIVMAWNFFDYIVANNAPLVDKDVKFINIKDLQAERNTFQVAAAGR